MRPGRLLSPWQRLIFSSRTARIEIESITKSLSTNTMDRLPDEILEEILHYVMMHDDPFCIQEYFHDRYIAANHDLQRVHHSQRSSLLDWGLVVGTCKRFCRIGKEAFFSEKVFLMDSRFAVKLRNLEAGFLTTQDQYIATRHIRSIVFIDSIFLNIQDQHKWTRYNRSSPFDDSIITPPSSFLNLSSVILSFPRLERLDHLFGYRPGEVHLITQAAQDRRPAWSSFTDRLATIGVPTEKLDMGIMKCEGPTWDDVVNGLHWNIYPMLRGIGRVRAMRKIRTGVTS